MDPNDNQWALQPQFRPLSEAFLYASPERIDEMSFARVSTAFGGFDNLAEISGRRWANGREQNS